MSEAKLLSTIASTIANKFNGERSQWNGAKTQIMCKLADEELLELIEQTNDLKDVKMKGKSMKAWSIIMKQLTGTALIYGQSVKIGDAYGLWKLLLEKYESINRDLVYTIKMEIDSTMLKPGETIDHYKARLDINFMKLGNMSQFGTKMVNGEENKFMEHPYEVKDDDKIFIFTKGIPNDLYSFGSLKIHCSQQQNQRMKNVVYYFQIGKQK
jgi:hypothetical protein